MKIWNSFLKEIKIASSGFYFYMEIATAVIFLLVLMIIVPEESNSKVKELVFLDMPETVMEDMISQEINLGRSVRVEDTIFKLKPVTITYVDEMTGEKIVKKYDDKKEISLKTYHEIDSETGKVAAEKYIVDNFDDLLRISYKEKYLATKLYYGEDGLDYYKVILFGSETARYKNLLQVVVSNVDINELMMETMNQKVRYLDIPEILNNRQQYLPIIIVLMNSIMGMMIVVAYISVDKVEGLIKAYVVTPTSIYHYLMSKTMVVMFTAIMSTLIMTIPIMKLQPNYILLALSLLIITFMSCSFGLWISSYFHDIKSAFGIVMLATILLMIPSIAFLVPAFSQSWIKILPTYYMFEVIKESLMNNPDITFIMIANMIMMLIGILVFMISGKRYRKILSI